MFSQATAFLWEKPFVCVWAETGKLGRQLVGVKIRQVAINPTRKTDYRENFFCAWAETGKLKQLVGEKQVKLRIIKL